ncbi:hypothetical protein M5X11_12990 [Paenibacillus alginolyticus]|uniref:hypothetical protein n=1 Tax=Paenibacillus alginolyticus TaxID=59839 RepID=UPI000407FA1B|nr:hypothetical protein [Paenibacillus alginolyticus]MCY9665871.1 hypothetical protein [Paenibacillus alginolyticus]
MEYRNTQLEREMIMGCVLEGHQANTPIRWDWMNPDYATIAFLGDKEKSARKNIVSKVARNIHLYDDKVVFWITSDLSGESYPTETDDSIAWLEEKPDLPAAHDPNQYFRDRRGIFPATYFDLTAQGKGGFNFREYVPAVSYRAHMEGPTHGYHRIFESMGNSSAKEVLLHAINDTCKVKWHVTPEGRKFIIPAGVSVYEKAAAMVLAMWSFWAQICRLDNPQQFMLIIEPDKDILLGEHESEFKNHIFRTLDVMRSLSDEITMSLMLSLETMFPIPELGIRTRVYLQTYQSDFDMLTDEHEEFFGPLLYEEWGKGNSHVAYIQDSYTGESCIGELHPDRIRFAEQQVTHA